MIEYSITVKNENAKLTEKEISYDPITLSQDNPLLGEKVNRVFEKFLQTQKSENGTVQVEQPDIIIKATLIW